MGEIKETLMFLLKELEDVDVDTTALFDEYVNLVSLMEHHFKFDKKIVEQEQKRRYKNKG